MDFHNAFDSEGGKRVLENLSKECLEDELTFVRGESDSAAFNEGKRYVILHIRKILAKKPHKEKQKDAEE